MESQIPLHTSMITNRAGPVDPGQPLLFASYAANQLANKYGQATKRYYLSIKLSDMKTSLQLTSCCTVTDDECTQEHENRNS